MLTLIPDTAESTAVEKMVVVYESPAHREQVVRLCNEFKPGRQIEWCEARCPSESGAEQAQDADVIVFALSAGEDLPQELKDWIEGWVARRGEREGTLVGLFLNPPANFGTCLKEMYLRDTAHRAGMDYLSHLPCGMRRCIPDSLDRFNERAGQVTSLLDEILHKHLMPKPPI